MIKTIILGTLAVIGTIAACEILIFILSLLAALFFSKKGWLIATPKVYGLLSPPRTVSQKGASGPLMAAICGS